MARRGAHVRQSYRQLSVFNRKTRQTRRSAAGRGFLRCDGGLRHKQPGEPVREAPSKARNEFLTTTLARSPRFAFNAATAHRRDFGGSSSVISRTISLGIAQTKRRMRETPTRTRNAGSLDAAGPFQPGRSDAKFPANDFATGSHDLGKDSRDSQWPMTRMAGPADNSPSPSEQL